MTVERFRVTLTLIEEMLGTAASDAGIYEDYIARRAGRADTSDELASLPPEELVERGTSVFRRGPDGAPCIFDYQIKGFFKDACGSLRKADNTRSAKLAGFKKAIDGLLFVEPRIIPIAMPPGGAVGVCVRPLRAATMQGERVSLARSETVPADSTLAFDVVLLSSDLVELMAEWLDYGRLRGLGQWRNSGKGRFTAVVERIRTPSVVGR
ncbi:MAG TPA: hypothetical protein P5137_00925 [Candidatus Brocadiia bacterium]|nr:hypothetical protein [Candidatus Brocadiia bacterium]